MAGLKIRRGRKPAPQGSIAATNWMPESGPGGLETRRRLQAWLQACPTCELR